MYVKGKVLGEVMLKCLKVKIKNTLVGLLNSEKFKQTHCFFILIIETVRGNDGKTKTDS
ncbi:hypothetical protein [Bacillus mobilis]|uniref:hypothetical protein n=1 Tax=Bacillus mobilis TaxID=2026190 RepID=UPI00381F4C7A